MQPEQLLTRLGRENVFVSADPGDAGTINVTKWAEHVNIVTAGTETRTLNDPEQAGNVIFLTMKTDGGDCTVTVDTAYDQAGSTTIVFQDAGDAIALYSIAKGSDFVWRVLAFDGVTGPTIEMAGLSVDTLTVDTTINIPAGQIARSELVQDDLKAYKIPLTNFLAVDGAELGITEDASDLYRAISSNVVTLLGRTPETATEAASAAAQFSLPAEYVDGETVSVVVTAQFINGSGVDAMRASTIDVSVYEQAAGAVGADLCATSAIAFSADDTYETKTFTITPTTLVAGDLLNILVTASCVSDDANATQIQIGEVSVLCDVKG